MLRVVAVLWGVLLLLPGVSPGRDLPDLRAAGRAVMDLPSGPAGFGSDSAELTHTYYPMVAGDSVALSGYGVRSGDLRLLTAVAVELVDGVQCLRVRDEIFSSFSWEDDDGDWHLEYLYDRAEYWLAQDMGGNVWLLKMVDAAGSDTVFGAVDPPLELWREIVVGDVWVNDDGGEGAVVSVDASGGRLGTGIGPYQGALHIRTVYPDGLSIDRYFAPGMGLVQESYAQDGEHGGYDRVPSRAPEPGPGSVEFGAGRYSTTEEAGTFPVSVVRTGGSDGIVWVEFEVTGVTSTFIEENGEKSVYLSDRKVVYLAPGQTEAVFDVVVLDNGIWNNRRTGELQLSNPGGGADMGARSTATVNIDEAESGEDPGYFIGPCFLNTLLEWN